MLSSEACCRDEAESRVDLGLRLWIWPSREERENEEGIYRIAVVLRSSLRTILNDGTD